MLRGVGEKSPRPGFLSMTLRHKEQAHVSFPA